MPERSGWLAAAALVAMALGASAARAQDAPVDPYADPPATPPAEPPPAEPPPAEPPPEAPPRSSDPADDIDDQVAEALYARGQVLFERGAAADAKQLYIESLERSPHGPRSADALRGLRAANKKLGVANLEDGRPGDGPVDPYGGGTGEQPLDPYGGAAAGAAGQRDETGDGPSEGGRRAVMAWSAAAGLIAGLAVAGPESETTNDFGETRSEISGGAVLAGLLGAAAGFGGSWWLTERYPVTAGQSAAIVSGGTWGAIDIGLFGDAVTGTDSDPNDVWKFVGAGGLLGLGAGTWYAANYDPSEGDMAFVNSLGMIGTVGGLLVGVGIQPPESEAYSINALVGSLGGLTVGLALSDSVETSRRRMLFVDLGAAAGAVVPWLVLYPLIEDEGTENDEQAAGWLSALTLGGGAVAAWYLTRHMDDDADSVTAERGAPPPPALVQRELDGSWSLGAPVPRPLQDPALAAPVGRSFGADLVSGRF